MTAAFFSVSFAVLNALFSFRRRVNSSPLGRPCPGKGGKLAPIDCRAWRIHRHNIFSVFHAYLFVYPMG
jgi:hypothetical protein